ncbi:MAG: hypothetical protein ACRDMZ_00605, partial [Solirubrobacteraceae bacterium]
LTLCVGRAAVPGPIVLSARDLPGLAALWLFFLWLRVLDEHKDFEADAVAHPDRVLQRGLVTLGELRVVGGVSLAIQLAVSLWIDGGCGAVAAWWLAAVAWSLLMAKEFFVREWLRQHIMWYAFSHMVVMLLLVAWVAAMGAPGAVQSRAPWLLAALVYMSGLAFEMGRKMRAPQDEHPLADSYTQALGVSTATRALEVVVAFAAALALITVAAFRTGIPRWASVVAIGSVVLAVVVLGEFRRRPEKRTAKRVEAGVGVSILAIHIVVLTTVIQTRSIAWR